MMGFKLFVFYASYAVFPCAALFYLIFKKSKARWIRASMLTLLLLSMVFTYARFIEPRILHVEHQTVDLPHVELSKPIKVAIFADTHYGIFTHAMPASRIVKRINEENPDLVLIPGDFLYHIKSEEDITRVFNALKDVRAPIFGVTGNHDIGRPGPDLGKVLFDRLEPLGVDLLDDEIKRVDINSSSVTLVGFTDLWKKPIDYSHLIASEDEIVIALGHNPDTAYDIPSPEKIDLLVSGHTHGGQIRLPFLYKKAIPTEYPFDLGEYHVRGMKVFVTPGTGMVGLPFRFLMPPRLDIVEVR